MSANQRDENEFPVEEKEEGINDGDEVDGRDNIIDNEVIKEHDIDYGKVENIEEIQKEERSRSNGNNNDKEDLDIDEDDDHDYTKVFNDNDINDFRVQRAIRREESIDTIMKILNFFPLEVRQKNKLGYYPLHTACVYGHETAAMKLIELFPEAAQYLTSDRLFMYPLQLAILSRDMSEIVVMKLIEIFPIAVIESTKRDRSALLLACDQRSQHERVITKLIDIHPLAIQEKYANAEYPIHRAIKRNQPITVIKLLLDGDPLGMERRIESMNKETPFHLAFIDGNHDLVEYFMQRSDVRMNVRDGSGTASLCMYLCHR